MADKQPRPRLVYIGPGEGDSSCLLQAIGRAATFEAVCSEEAERIARRYGARWTFDDIAAMLRETEPDGVVIGTGVSGRFRLIKQCLAAGAGVLTAGAPGSAAACKRIHSFGKLSGRTVLAAPAIRFSPASFLARRLIESGKFGSPISMTIQSTRRGAPRDVDEHGGPVATDQVFEALDVVHSLLGPIAQFFAAAHEDGALAVLGMSVAGVPVSMTFHSRGAADSVGLEADLRASDGGRLRIDSDARLYCGNGSRVDAVHRPTMAMTDPAVELGYLGLLGEFGRQLRFGSSSSGLIGPATTVTAATEAVFASLQRGRPTSPKSVSAAGSADTKESVSC